MKPMSIVIGGLIPAVMFAISTVLMKQSTKDGISIWAYLVFTGLSVVGLGFTGMTMGGSGWTAKSAGSAAGAGLAWAVAVACMVYGMGALKLPVGVVSPLSNSSVLLAVLLAAWLFGEWKDMSVMKLLVGTLLIFAGATLVSMASGSK